MHYELYVDSLLLINFGMNLYLIMLVNLSTFRTAAPWRMLLGALTGSMGYVLMLVGILPPVLRLPVGILAGGGGMLLIAFPVKSLRTLLKLSERLLLAAFGMGGIQLFLIRCFPTFRQWLTGVWGILTVGGIAFLFLGRVMTGRREKDCVCRATLRREGASMTVVALIDSGNSLVEPISGKPVSVVEEEVFRALWENSMQGFRAIPYHSVGKSRGILNGYLLPELALEVGGVRKELRDVYIAVSSEGLHAPQSAAEESIKLIVNPRLLEEDGRGRPRRRQNERTYDSESGNTGKNAV